MKALASILIGAALATTGSAALAQQGQVYSVRITNISAGQTFTPQLVVTHRASWRMFALGEPASDALATMAEGGDTEPLMMEAGPLAHDLLTVPGLLGPGQSVDTMIRGPAAGGRITVTGMLIPTNDSFFALNAQPLPTVGSESFYVPAYDAGSEANDQNCRHIPGPLCGGEGVSAAAESDEGFVHIGNGFHEIELVDESFEVLAPRLYDWRNPVARITVRRVQP